MILPFMPAPQALLLLPSLYSSETEVTDQVPMIVSLRDFCRAPAGSVGTAIPRHSTVIASMLSVLSRFMVLSVDSLKGRGCGRTGNCEGLKLCRRCSPFIATNFFWRDIGIYAIPRKQFPNDACLDQINVSIRITNHDIVQCTINLVITQF